jgi:hypothetical protein
VWVVLVVECVEGEGGAPTRSDLNMSFVVGCENCDELVAKLHARPFLAPDATDY